MEFPQSFVELENFDTCPVSYHYHLYHKKVGVKYFKLILFRVTFPSVSVLSKFSIISILLCSVSCSFSNSFFPCQLRFRDDTHKTSMKIPIFKTPPVHLRPEFCHPLDLGRPISNEPPFPPLQMINNQLKENIIQG